VTASRQNDQLTPVKTTFPTVLLLTTIALLIAASFVPDKPAVSNGLICLAMMFIGIVEACCGRIRPACSASC
jgi:hypothetical protein